MCSGEPRTAKPVESVNIILNFFLIIHQSGFSLQLHYMFICQLLLRPFITLNPSSWRSQFYRPLMSLHFAFGFMCFWRYSEGKSPFVFLGELHAIMTVTCQMKIHMTFSYKELNLQGIDVGQIAFWYNILLIFGYSHLFWLKKKKVHLMGS